jgi:hypothetical protein
MHCEEIEEFIHYPTWNWDEAQYMLVCVKTCEKRWYYNKNMFTSIFLCVFHLHYSQWYLYKSIINHASVNRIVQKIM